MSSTGPPPGAKLRLASVLQEALPRRLGKFPLHHWRILNALKRCRSPELGGHLYRCEQCQKEQFVPRSCGNRHCPDCQSFQARQWLDRQEQLLLPVAYFHLVFTLDHALNPLVRQNRPELYNLLLASASATLLQFGRNNLKAQLGVTLVLHTWNQLLLDHYHVHGIVTGGGLALDGQSWVDGGERFLFHVQPLSQVFQGKFCQGLKKLFEQGRLSFHGKIQHWAGRRHFLGLLKQLRAKSWNVYAKRPFAGPQEVLRYLCGYTHRVGLSNGRLLRLDPAAGTLTFSYKIRRKETAPLWRSTELPLGEFLRRFCLHLLPPRFVKIRHYGLLANRGRQQRIQRVKALLGAAESAALDLSRLCEPAQDELEAPAPALSTERWLCPACGCRGLVLVDVVAPRAPP